MSEGEFASLLDFCRYQGESLIIENVPVPALVAEFGTPLIVYSKARLQENGRRLMEAWHNTGLRYSVAYAFKACYYSAVTGVLARGGLQAEVMSTMEWLLAKKAGFSSEGMVVNGPGKGLGALTEMLLGGIRQFNIDSLDDLDRLDKAARVTGRKPDVLIRVHVNCDNALFVGSGTKLGFDIPSGQALEACTHAGTRRHLHFAGLSTHIFSRERTVTRYLGLVDDLLSFAREVEAQVGPVSLINIGGGVDARYLAEVEGFRMERLASEVAARIRAFRHGVAVQFEPGRYCVSDAAVGIGRVISVKYSKDFPWIILDLATNTLIPTPSAYFQVIPAAARGGSPVCLGIADGVCSPANVIQARATLPLPKIGELLAVLNCGAYAAVMGESWTFPQAPVVLVDGDTVQPVFTREQSCRVLKAIYGVEDPKVFL